MIDGSVTLVAVYSRELGQIRVTCRAWDEPKVFKEGEVLELRWTTQGVTAHRRLDLPLELPEETREEIDSTPPEETGDGIDPTPIQEVG